MMVSLGPLLQRVVQLFSVETLVRETAYTTVSGVDQQVEPTERTIFAAIDPSNARRLEQIFGGSISGGSIGVYTSSEETLYFVDQTASGVERRQSFVYDGQLQYRIVNEADWTRQCGVKVYLAERHVTQDRV